jgi:O-methyltransferase domain/Dimerisation domain
MAEPKPDHIMDVVMGFMSAKTLMTAVELGLFSVLGDGALDAEHLRQRLELHPRSAHDFFDTLVALGLLERDGGRYSNTLATGLYLDRAKPSYIGGLIEMLSARLYPFWGSLGEALKTAIPQNESKTHGPDFFQALYADPARVRLFLQAMTGISLPSAKAIARKFDFSRYETFADVGAAQGGCAVQISLAHPHLRGSGFDLPVVGPVFEEYVASFGLSDRLRFVPGSFFTDPLPRADVLVMGHILHDWNLDEKRALIRKAYEALPPGGAFIVYEALIDDQRRQHVNGLLMSLNMLIETPGGFDYSGADGASWMREAGFRDTYVEVLAGLDSMLVGFK